MKLYFLRHGETKPNLDKVYTDDVSAIVLTDRGVAQAQAAGLYAQTLGLTRIIASPQERAIQTARIVAGAAGLNEQQIISDIRLHEIRVGDLAGTPTRGLRGFLEHQAQPDGDTQVEPVADVYTRLRSFIASLAGYPADNVLLVGHSGSGLILQGLLTNDTIDLEQRPNLPNAQIIELPNPGKVVS